MNDINGIPVTQSHFNKTLSLLELHNVRARMGVKTLRGPTNNNNTGMATLWTT